MSEMRSSKTDINYLLNDQYKSAVNLNARAQLHERFSTNKQGWQHWLFDQLDLPPQARIIEFGCGPGWLWAENQDRIPSGWDITLSDFSSGMVEESKRRLAGCAHPFTYEVVNIQSVPREDASFDVAIANHMLYHVPDLRKALGEMRRILKPGGRLFTATNGEHHLREIYDIQEMFDPDLSFWEGFSAAHSFELDSGVALLSEFFPQVELRRYEDSMEVTEAEPLVAYILSGPGKALITGDNLGQLREFLQGKLDADGGVHITKDSGLLISSLEPLQS